MHRSLKISIASKLQRYIPCVRGIVDIFAIFIMYFILFFIHYSVIQSLTLLPS